MTNASSKGSRRMPFRQRLLLALHRVCSGMQTTDFQTLLFLYCQEVENTNLYQFVPCQYGAFSFTADADRHRLVERGFLWVETHKEPAKWHLTRKGRYACRGIEDERLTAFAYRYRDLCGDELIAATYRRFPDYDTRSEVEEARNHPDTSKGNSRLLTIGYEGRSLEDFLNQLIRSNVAILCDIRKNAISRKYGFSKRTLHQACQSIGIRYEHKPELGIAPALRQDLKTQADCDNLFSQYQKTVLLQQQEKIKEIYIWLQNRETVALTCFEREAHRCHRHCVAEALESKYMQDMKKLVSANTIWQGCTQHIQ